MQLENAQQVVQEALKNVNFINYARVLESLTKYDFNKYDGNKWHPNFKQAALDHEWLKDHFTELIEAFDLLKDKKNH